MSEGEQLHNNHDKRGKMQNLKMYYEVQSTNNGLSHPCMEQPIQVSDEAHERNIFTTQCQCNHEGTNQPPCHYFLCWHNHHLFTHNLFLHHNIQECKEADSSLAYENENCKKNFTGRKQKQNGVLCQTMKLRFGTNVLKLTLSKNQ